VFFRTRSSIHENNDRTTSFYTRVADLKNSVPPLHKLLMRAANTPSTSHAVLLSYMSKIGVRDGDGLTPLDYAVAGRDSQAERMLLEHGAKISLSAWLRSSFDLFNSRDVSYGNPDITIKFRAKKSEKKNNFHEITVHAHSAILYSQLPQFFLYITSLGDMHFMPSLFWPLNGKRRRLFYVNEKSLNTINIWTVLLVHAYSGLTYQFLDSGQLVSIREISRTRRSIYLPPLFLPLL